ncbi:hypothetical protein AJ78_01484 [Emergomyces pasteurianus Ep9510]|uniref:Uncharacterized protein n=1 Tax=Emergomyces pasteurianus Ep9510 TaxID=1447872 RepID=A0A1J9QQN2_9EURO|nr:hypothetical protein AJ78_01484 [Emergomyces pasteurianus Ep9510]
MHIHSHPSQFSFLIHHSARNPTVQTNQQARFSHTILLRTSHRCWKPGLLSAEPSLLLFAVGTSSTDVLSDVLKPWNQRARARSTTPSPSYSTPSSAQSPSTPEHQRVTSMLHAQSTEVSEPELEPPERLPTSQPRPRPSKLEWYLCSLRDNNSPELPSNLSGIVQNVMLFNRETREIIPSGTGITLRTDDPDTKPLPNKTILDMQLVLHRLAALSGGADILELDVAPDYDDSDGPFNLDIR